MCENTSKHRMFTVQNSHKIHSCHSIGDQKVHFIFLKDLDSQEVLSHSFICLPLPYMEGITLICNMDFYCVIAILNGHR